MRKILISLSLTFFIFTNALSQQASTDFHYADSIATTAPDTQAAIAGSVAEAFYGGVPNAILNKGMAYPDKEMLAIITQFQNRIAY